MDIPKQLFKDTRNWFINRVSRNNQFYKFTDIEGVQLKNILKRLTTGICKKYPNMQGQELNEAITKAFQETVEFADRNGYSLTAMNIINKFNNIMEHIRNDRLGKHNKGFDPNQNTWINTLKTNHIHTRTNELFDNGVRQISNGTAGSDKPRSDIRVD